MSSYWIDNAPENPIKQLTTDELLDTWLQNRNNLYSVVIAEEVMRRLVAERNK